MKIKTLKSKKPRAKHLNEVLVKTKSGKHKDKRFLSRSELKQKLKDEII